MRLPRKAGASLLPRTGLFESSVEEYDVLKQRYLQVLAIYERLSLLRSQFPFVLNGRFGTPMRVEGDWDLPDIICADWEVESGSEEQPRFDETLIRLKRHLGAPEVGLCGASIKLSLTHESATPDFFQALSSTRWASQSELVLAEGVHDEALVDTLRSLGHQFSVGITSLGLNLNKLDDLPDAESIVNMSVAEFEAVQGYLHPQRIALAPLRPTIDWATLSSLRKKHVAVGELVKWLSDCLERRLLVR
jgi:hypothetical protein